MLPCKLIFWHQEYACPGCSFMAEVPHAHASRLQALLAWLAHLQSGAALCFLLPGLLLCSQAGNEDLDLGQPATNKRWHETLLQPEASCFLHGHSRIVSRQLKSIFCCNDRPSEQLAHRHLDSMNIDETSTSVSFFEESVNVSNDQSSRLRQSLVCNASCRWWVQLSSTCAQHHHALQLLCTLPLKMLL